jgi:hypothetical protein
LAKILILRGLAWLVWDKIFIPKGLMVKIFFLNGLRVVFGQEKGLGSITKAFFFSDSILAGW